MRDERTPEEVCGEAYWNPASQVISLITWLRKIYLTTDNGLIEKESQQNSF